MRVVALKNFTGELKVAEEPGVLVNQAADLPYKKGELLFFPIAGEPQILSGKYVEERFVEVEVKKSKKKAITKKYDLDEIEKAYKQDWINNEDYIFETELTKNKVF